MQEVSVGAMDLDELESNDLAALDGVDKGMLHLDNFARVIVLGLGKSLEKGILLELQTILPEGHFSLTVDFGGIATTYPCRAIRSRPSQAR